MLFGSSLDNEIMFCILGFPYMQEVPTRLVVAALAANGFPDIVLGLVNT